MNPSREDTSREGDHEWGGWVEFLIYKTVAQSHAVTMDSILIFLP
jgi:hypothetical protein